MKNEKWTTADIPELSGKVIIVTGGNSGIGYESVKAFAQKGAEVILACRSVEKGEAAKGEILKNMPTGKIKVMTLDLMDLSSVKNFVAKFKENYRRLDQGQRTKK
ncbi:MAG: SDR family NAD(P)-dependent oxidoreductase [Bacteroidales bacterium]